MAEAPYVFVVEVVLYSLVPPAYFVIWKVKMVQALNSVWQEVEELCRFASAAH